MFIKLIKNQWTLISTLFFKLIKKQRLLMSMLHYKHIRIGLNTYHHNKRFIIFWLLSSNTYIRSAQGCFQSVCKISDFINNFWPSYLLKCPLFNMSFYISDIQFLQTYLQRLTNKTDCFGNLPYKMAIFNQELRALTLFNISYAS